MIKHEVFFLITSAVQGWLTFSVNGLWLGLNFLRFLQKKFFLLVIYSQLVKIGQLVSWLKHIQPIQQKLILSFFKLFINHKNKNCIMHSLNYVQIMTNVFKTEVLPLK